MGTQVFISIFCTVFGLLIGYLTFVRNRDTELRNDASQSAIIKTQLAGISSGVESIRIDIKAQEVRVTVTKGGGILG